MDNINIPRKRGRPLGSKKKIINNSNEKFEKPAVVICNHHSVIDSLLMQALNPKLI